MISNSNAVATMTLRGVPLDASDDERELFESMIDSMQQGFAGTFAQLDDYLEQIQA